MPKTKLGKRVSLIRKVKSYKNNDPRCRYPWILHDYCWGYAVMIDKGGGEGNFRDFFCKDCEYWKEIK